MDPRVSCPTKKIKMRRKEKKNIDSENKIHTYTEKRGNNEFNQKVITQ